MRLTIILSLSVLFAAGCNEYTFTEAQDIHGVNNPLEIETPVNDDHIVQVTIPKADILFVVDDSSSMEPEQTQLAMSFPLFLDYFLGSGLDYHIGTISTDFPTDRGKLEMGQGELFITDQTQNPQAAFQAMAEMGGYGDSYEAGITTSFAALTQQRDAFNAGFYREEASLHVIVMSDENSWDSNHGIVTVEEYINWMTTLKPSEDMTTFNSIVNQPDCCGGMQNPMSESAGTRYFAVTDAVGGINWDVKSNDWDRVLEQLGMQAAGLSREFFLTELPVIGTIEVHVNDGGVDYAFEEDVDWTYSASRNSVLFTEYVPDPLSQVSITYQVLAAQAI